MNNMIYTIVMAALAGGLLYFANKNYTNGNYMLFVLNFFIAALCFAGIFMF